MDDPQFIEMQLAEIQISDILNQHQVIILKEKDGERHLPIFIGFFEASAMDLSIKRIQTPRPLTHDLIYNIIDACKLQLKHILVDDLSNKTFHGKLVIENETGEEIWVDSRPSDAIVLASKRGLPIFVHESVLQKIAEDEEEDEESDFPDFGDFIQDDSEF